MKEKQHQAKDPVLEANIEFHTALAKQYEKSQPYFDDINTKRVAAILKTLAEQAGGETLLDIGCGTGFICGLAAPIFKEVIGLDATPAMLAHVEPADNLRLIQGDARHVTYPDASFNVCTAYGVLHHMEDIGAVAREVYRLLKPGGRFYSDEDPNYSYFNYFDQLDPDFLEGQIWVANEYKNLSNKALEMKEQFDVDEGITKLAEFQKMTKGGMHTEAVCRIFMEAGFKHVEVEYRWYLGEASVRKNLGVEQEGVINRYLTSALPVSRRMFKYFKLIAQKESQ